MGFLGLMDKHKSPISYALDITLTLHARPRDEMKILVDMVDNEDISI